MIVVGILCSVIVGLSFPMYLAIFKEVINGFAHQGNKDEAVNTMDRMLKWYMLLGFGTLVVGFVQMFCLTLSAKRQGCRIRLLLFQVGNLLISILISEIYSSCLFFTRRSDKIGFEIKFNVKFSQFQGANTRSSKASSLLLVLL